MKSLITVHATGTGPGLHLTGKDIDRRDRANGYSKCGYHFVIARNGDVTEGRKLTEASIHDAPEDAAHAVSVCLVGGQDANQPSDNFTLPQWESFRTLLRVIGERNALTSVKSKTEALTENRINQIIWRPNHV